MNKWMIKHGFEPIAGTPFKAKDGKLYELSTQNKRIKVLSGLKGGLKLLSHLI